MTQLPSGQEMPPWPAGMPAPYGYLVAWDGPPAPRGLIADVVLDGAGLYLAATTPELAVRVRLARVEVPGLPVVPTGVKLTHGPVDGSLWAALVDHARAAMPHEILLAIVARDPREGELFVADAGPYTLVEPQLDEAGTGEWQPQQASGCGVRATPIPDALVEVHSHHRLRAYFSSTDDRDETTRRVYGVLGRLDSPSPELALRAVTGCRPHAVEPVAFHQVFAGELGGFRDVPFSVPTDDEPPGRTTLWLPGRAPRGRSRPPLLATLLLGMADDLASIRTLLETRSGPEPEPPLWTR